MRRSLLLISAVLCVLAGCTEHVTESEVPVALQLVAISPTALDGVVGAEVTPAPTVRVIDAAGAAVAGVQVTFKVIDGSGTIGGTTVMTVQSDADGLASAPWILGAQVGTDTVEVKLGRAAERIRFTAASRAGAARRIARVSGDNQSGFLGEALPLPLSVSVADTHGNAVAGAVVTFSVSGGGEIAGATAITNDAGVATSGRWTLGRAGQQDAIASMPDIPQVPFRANGYARCDTPCDNGKLAFARAGNIYTANADGSGLLQLTTGGTFSHPAWSPDGRTIAFVSTVHFSYTIHLINADGSGQRLFGSGFSPAWSPDGRRLAFSAIVEGQIYILVKAVEPDGKPPVRIGFDRGVNTSPAWSPDGRRIAFTSDWSAFDFAVEVYIADADGSNVVQITDGFFAFRSSWPTYFTYPQPAWSPDGSKIAMLVCPEWQYYRCETAYLAVMNHDGTAIREIAQAAGYSRPAWTNDGASIVFSRTCWEHERCASSAFVVSAIGTNERLLIPNAYDVALSKR